MRLKKGEMALPQVLLAHGRCGFAPAYLLLHSNRIQGRDMCLGCSDRAIRSDDVMTGRHGNFDEVQVLECSNFCALSQWAGGVRS